MTGFNKQSNPGYFRTRGRKGERKGERKGARKGEIRTLLNSITSHFFQLRRNGTREHSLDSLSFCDLGSGKIPMFVSRKNFLVSVFVQGEHHVVEQTV